jgi:SHS2 domain-containing protein
VSYRFVDHTAELQLEIEAPSKAAVFEEAVLALRELLGGDGPPPGQVPGQIQARELSVTADDDPALFAAWLEEIVFVAETEGLVPQHAGSVEAGDTAVRGTVSFVAGSPPHLVKGVTYHDLVLAPHGATWRARAVLDV